MVEILEPGVGAFRGKNRAGKLSDFIDAVKNNAIPSDSWLYCENLDRLSRDQVDEALRLFLELRGVGLTIVTGMDRKVYNSKSIRQTPIDLMISILMFNRGNEESETKSNRVPDNYHRIRDFRRSGHAFLDSIALFRGYPATIRTDQGAEFTCRALEQWAFEHGV